jgi:hypothetical protein
MMAISTCIGATKRSLLLAFVVAAVAAPLAQARALPTARVDQQDRAALAAPIKQVEAQFSCVSGGTYVRHVDPFSGLVNNRVRFSLSRAGLGPSTTFVDVPVSSFLAQENLPGGVLFQMPSYVSPSEIVRTACGSSRAPAGG